MNVEPLDIDAHHHIVVLTGAGVSVASGLPTYRGPEGLWQNEDIALYAVGETFLRDPLAVWNAFGEIRAKLLDAKPNAAHHVLAALERRFDTEVGRELTVITQNVDGLHQAAGSRNVIELHGNALRTRCTREGCRLAPFHDERTSFGRLPICEACASILRPDVVLFGELLGAEAEERATRALRTADLFIAVGTSGAVIPAAHFVRSAKHAGARTLLVNLEPSDPPNPFFDAEILGRAEELLPRLLDSN